MRDWFGSLAPHGATTDGAPSDLSTTIKLGSSATPGTPGSATIVSLLHSDTVYTPVCLTGPHSCHPSQLLLFILSLCKCHLSRKASPDLSYSLLLSTPCQNCMQSPHHYLMSKYNFQRHKVIILTKQLEGYANIYLSPEGWNQQEDKVDPKGDIRSGRWLEGLKHRFCLWEACV